MTTCQPQYSPETQEFMAIYLASSPERQHIIGLLITLLTIYKGNRDAQGRFRKVPFVPAQFRESLLMLKGLQEYQSEAFQTEIQAQLKRCDEMEAQAQP